MLDYATHDGFINGANGIFQGSTKVFNSQKVIWILYNNPKCGQFRRINNAHLYEHEIHPTWTLVEPISKDIPIGSNSFHIIIITQFPIQLVAARTIHRTLGWTLDYLSIDPTNVYKHGLTYTTSSHVKEKKNPFTTFANEFFSNWSKCCHGDASIANHCMMGCTCPQPTYIRDSHVLIYFLNIRSLPLHKNDIFSYYNLKIVHILCFNETHFNTLMSNNTSLNIDTRTHSMISVKWSKWYNDYIWQFHNLIITWNFYIFRGWIYYNNIQCKYKKCYSYKINIQTFNIILVNVHNSSSKVFGSNAKFLSHYNNWQFQYWHVWSKLNTTKWTPKFYGPIFNGTSIFKNYINLWISYSSHMDKYTHSTMHVRSCWSLLD